MQGADLVVWIGPELTPWLAKPLATLAGQAARVGLLNHPGTARLAYRDTMAPGTGAGHDDHPHDHAGSDPHAWLDPDNASAWLGVIAEELAELDPANAGRYRANAAAGQERLALLSDRIEARLVTGFATFRSVAEFTGDPGASHPTAAAIIGALRRAGSALRHA